MENADIKQTQREIRINSTTVVIVTIIGFVISLALYIFFVIIPIQRLEKKADQVLDSVARTSSLAAKAATDIENIIQELEELKDRFHVDLKEVREFVCTAGPTFCSTLSGLEQTACNLAVTEFCGSS